MSVPLAVTLAELRTPLEQAYRNTVYCSANLQQEGGTLVTRYCGNRWCLCCNRIRTGRAMNRYLPVVDTWERSQLVTLTIRNVRADLLPVAIRGMIKQFQAIKLAMRRTDKVKLVALRKLECTYNSQRDDYHPHFHIVTKDRAMAQLLRDRWLDAYGEVADAKGQDVRPCDGHSLREVFKYFTKLMAKQRHKSDSQGKSAPVDPRALNVIFTAMRSLRVYQPVGFKGVADVPDENAEIAPDQATPALTRPTETILWEWSQALTDWIDQRTGECLTGYEPAVKFRDFVERIAQPPPTDARPIGRLDDIDNRQALRVQVTQGQRRLREYVARQVEQERAQAREFDPSQF
jgi:hypothetical protein